MSSSSQAKAKAVSKPANEQGIYFYNIMYGISNVLINRLYPEVQQTFSRLQNELQALASKIGELEAEAEEHE